MRIIDEQIHSLNQKHLETHNSQFNFLTQSLHNKGFNVDSILNQVADFQVAIPSWALGAGGTRFGRFSYAGEPSTLEDKMSDIGIIHRLTRKAGAISLHIPWDIPQDYDAILELAKLHQISFDAVNSNTFQDYNGNAHSYKFGSLSNYREEIRQQAVEHNKTVINIGKKLGSKSITVWLADGASFPGQKNFQKSLSYTEASLKSIYSHLPEDWKMLIEYKPFEPSFYSTVIMDWGTSFMLANSCGEKAFTLVDLGHHLPNTNIEQIVSTLMLKGKLGGFHFNDSKYGDDDLTAGSIKPYALFLIFNELVYGIQHNPQNPSLSWMIDASHNIKDPLEDLIQSLDAISESYAKALLIDQAMLADAQDQNDAVRCQEILQGAFRTDVRPLLAEVRIRNGAALDPIAAYRGLNVRKNLIRERGINSVATGL